MREGGLPILVRIRGDLRLHVKTLLGGLPQEVLHGNVITYGNIICTRRIENIWHGHIRL